MSEKNDIIKLLKEIRVEASRCAPNWAIIQGAAGEAWELVEQLQAEIKRLKGEQKGKTCMCMDCGKVIKVTEQSKHLKECPKQRK
ncbi:MAG: hypothetical protein ACUZ9M_00805 [Candidatus Scalindua sp.]